MQRALLLDIIIRKSATVLQLLTGEDKTLLIRRDALLVLDFRLHIVDGVASLDVQGDGFAGQSLDKNLHASAQAQDEMQRALLLDIIVRKSATVLQLLTSKDKTLLIRRDALLV